jgi:autotransporter-associated beta strand protein
MRDSPGSPGDAELRGGRRRWAVVLGACAIAHFALPGTLVHAAPASYPILAWHDEFDGAAIDPTRWTFDLGTGAEIGLQGWGNRELQHYTSRPTNVAVRDGHLLISAHAERFAGSSYTSARLKTQGLFSQTGGRFEVRAALPIGRGLWPAIWMMPEHDPYGGWAASGEIDIMEARGQQPHRIEGTIHYGGPWPDNTSSGGVYFFPQGQSIAGFNTYALEWDVEPVPEIRWYVNDVLYSRKTSWWSSGGAHPAPFDQPFHLILNLAVGGNYVGSPDASTPFPATMQVDFVRAYRAQVGGAVIDVAEGSRRQAEVGYARIGSVESVTKTGAGRLVFDVANEHAGPTVVRQGRLEIAHGDALQASPTVIEAGGTLGLSPGVSLQVPALTLAGGLVDLGTGRIRIGPSDVSPETALREALAAGRAGGEWDGITGIMSSAARQGPAGFAAGYRVDPVDHSALVAWTSLGDADLDGSVTTADVNALLTSGLLNSGMSGASWSQGDFDYDGFVTTADLNAMLTTGRLNAGIASPDANYPMAGVPEPSSAWPALLGLTGGGVAWRLRTNVRTRRGGRRSLPGAHRGSREPG